MIKTSDWSVITGSNCDELSGYQMYAIISCAIIVINRTLSLSHYMPTALLELMEGRGDEPFPPSQN
jgi:hypothetical protein